MATRKPARKASGTAKRVIKRASSAAKPVSAEKVAEILKLLCASLAHAGQALAKLRDAQTDATLREALSAEIGSLNSNRLLAESALSKGVGEGKVGVQK